MVVGISWSAVIDRHCLPDGYRWLIIVFRQRRDDDLLQMLAQYFCKTKRWNGSISHCAAHSQPACSRPWSKAPMPENRLRNLIG